MDGSEDADPAVIMSRGFCGGIVRGCAVYMLFVQRFVSTVGMYTTGVLRSIVMLLLLLLCTYVLRSTAYVLCCPVL